MALQSVTVLPQYKDTEKTEAKQDNTSCHAGSTHSTGNNGVNQDLLGGEDINPILMAKMNLVNNAINEIGWTNFHLKLFCLSGFGYAVEPMVGMLQSIVATQAYAEIGHGGYPTGLTMAIYAGLLVGALFWGAVADIIGRRIAFNTTLFIASIATLIGGAMPNWPSLGLFVALIGFGGGGNLVLDPTVFLEFLPANKQYLVTAMASWWGFGQAASGGVAWGFYSRSEWTCDVSSAEPSDCTWHNNKSWRLIMFTCGGAIFIMSIIRVAIFRLTETPKYLVVSGQESKLVLELQALASKYNRPCSLTLDQLQACGELENNTLKVTPFNVLKKMKNHLKGLFATRKLGVSTILLWLSWTLIGLSWPLFFIYLPSLISSRVPDQDKSFNTTWRDYTVTSLVAFIGPLIAAFLAEIKFLGRKYTMALGALTTAALFFGYTAVKTPVQNLALSCSISIAINIYYGTLFAYSAEVLPSAQRTTGNGIGVALNRVMGLLSAVIAVVADTTTPTPLYVCAVLFLVMMVISILFPFEPLGRRAS